MRVIYRDGDADWSAHLDDSGHVTIAVKPASTPTPETPVPESSWLVVADAVWHAGSREIIPVQAQIQTVTQAARALSSLIREEKERQEFDQGRGPDPDAEDEVAQMKADMLAAAGELPIPMPEPGTDMARLLCANVLLRCEVQRLKAALDQA